MSELGLTKAQKFIFGFCCGCGSGAVCIMIVFRLIFNCNYPIKNYGMPESFSESYLRLKEENIDPYCVPFKIISWFGR